MTIYKFINPLMVYKKLATSFITEKYPRKGVTLPITLLNRVSAKAVRAPLGYKSSLVLARITTVKSQHFNTLINTRTSCRLSWLHQVGMSTNIHSVLANTSVKPVVGSAVVVPTTTGLRSARKCAGCQWPYNYMGDLRPTTTARMSAAEPHSPYNYKGVSVNPYHNSGGSKHLFVLPSGQDAAYLSSSSLTIREIVKAKLNDFSKNEQIKIEKKKYDGLRNLVNPPTRKMSLLASVKNLSNSTLKHKMHEIKPSDPSMQLTNKTEKFKSLNGISSLLELKSGTLSKSIPNILGPEKVNARQGRERTVSSNRGGSSKKLLNGSYSKLTEIKLIKVSLASATRIRQWAEKTLPNGKVIGEVMNAETLHYKTFKPIKGGLFCERIFGPLQDHVCACGKKFNLKTYLRQQDESTQVTSPSIININNMGSLDNGSLSPPKRYFCRLCDVEYTFSTIRRTQLGYIKLATPVTHVWFVKGAPNYMSILLDMKKKDLHKIIYNNGTITLENALKGKQLIFIKPADLYETWAKVAKSSAKLSNQPEPSLRTEVRSVSLMLRSNISVSLRDNLLKNTVKDSSKDKMSLKREEALSGLTQAQVYQIKKQSYFSLIQKTESSNINHPVNIAYKFLKLTLPSPSNLSGVVDTTTAKLSGSPPKPRPKQIFLKKSGESSPQINTHKNNWDIFTLFEPNSLLMKNIPRTPKKVSLTNKPGSDVVMPTITGDNKTKSRKNWYNLFKHYFLKSKLTRQYLRQGNLPFYGRNVFSNVYAFSYGQIGTLKNTNKSNFCILFNRLVTEHQWLLSSEQRSEGSAVIVGRKSPQNSMGHRRPAESKPVVVGSAVVVGRKSLPTTTGRQWLRDLRPTTTGRNSNNRLTLRTHVRRLTRMLQSNIRLGNAQLLPLLPFTKLFTVLKKSLFIRFLLAPYQNNMNNINDFAETKLLVNQGRGKVNHVFLFKNVLNQSIHLFATVLYKRVNKLGVAILPRNNYGMVTNLDTPNAAKAALTEPHYKERKPRLNNTGRGALKNGSKIKEGIREESLRNLTSRKYKTISETIKKSLTEVLTLKLQKFKNKKEPRVRKNSSVKPFLYWGFKYKKFNSNNTIIINLVKNLSIFLFLNLNKKYEFSPDASDLAGNLLSSASIQSNTTGYERSRFNLYSIYKRGKEYNRGAHHRKFIENNSLKLLVHKLIKPVVLGTTTAAPTFDSKWIIKPYNNKQIGYANVALSTYLRTLGARPAGKLGDFSLNLKHSIYVRDYAPVLTLQSRAWLYQSHLNLTTDLLEALDRLFSYTNTAKSTHQTKSFVFSEYERRIDPERASKSLDLQNISKIFQNNCFSTLINNIYCVSHRYVWEEEKNWRRFSLFYYAPKAVETKSIPVYKNRNYDQIFLFDSMGFLDNTEAAETKEHVNIIKARQQLKAMTNTMNIYTTFSGPGIIEKLLNEFNFTELKKMDKQNRILLVEYNAHIAQLKKGIPVPTKLTTRFNKTIEDRQAKKSRSDYYKACQIRDIAIRRTKLIRKLFVKANSVMTPTTAGLNTSILAADPVTAPSIGQLESTTTADLPRLRAKQYHQMNVSSSLNISSSLNMVLTVLPVLPPDLRPIVKMDGKQAIADLNMLYKNIIYRNERLKKFLKDPALNNSFEMKYAQRLVQEAVDNLIQNGKSGDAIKDARGRLLKSLSDGLKGKQGRFRQYLLGKRVDYSARSVIVVGPRLKLHECGIPKEIALTLYLPFLIKRILNDKLALTVPGAKGLIQKKSPLIWQLLREIMKTCPVLLNRAPTLHRLGFQAFQPKLIDGKAILLHPLVCPAFNADFDGDQMAVHIPITTEAKTEAWKLMLARNNLLSPATGEPLILPSQDMVLGCYYLTTFCTDKFTQYKKGTGFYFHTLSDVLKAYNQQLIDIQAHIWVNLTSSVLKTRLTGALPYNNRGVATSVGYEDYFAGRSNDQPIEIRLSMFNYKLADQSIKEVSLQGDLAQKIRSNDAASTLSTPNLRLYYDPETYYKSIDQGSPLKYLDQPTKLLYRTLIISSKTHQFIDLFSNGQRSVLSQMVRTTPGRVLFNALVNKALSKSPKYRFSSN